MSHQIKIPYLKIGEFKVETPIGLSELLQPSWTTQIENDDVEEFVSQYQRIVFRNSEGQVVTKYVKDGDPNEHQSKSLEKLNA